jgi:cell division transport system permease protein
MSTARSRVGSAPSVYLPGGIRAWGRRHAFSLLSSLGTLVRQPIASAMTVMVLAVALCLPAGLWVTLDNASHLGQGWERLDTLSVFLDSGVDDQQAMRLSSRLSAWEEITAVDPISPSEGLAELAGQMGLGEAVATIEDNPLPWVLEVTPVAASILPELAERLQREDGVESVIVDLQWLERLAAMIEVIRQLTMLLALLFAAAVAFVVGNTIRMDIHNRREEIEVMALVGATGGFIRRPFLYSGLWYGLAGGLLAWLLVRLALVVLAGPVEVLGGAYDAELGLRPLSARLSLALVLGSGALGIIGSWLAVDRHLRRIRL